MKRKKSKLEESIFNRIRWLGYDLPDREYRFHPKRRWRFDFAWPKHKIAIEAEGGIWIAGRHNRGAGFIKDAEKYNEAVKMGWRVLRYTKSNLQNLEDDLDTVFNYKFCGIGK